MKINYPIISFFTRTSTLLLGAFMLITNYAVLSQKIVYSWWTVNLEGQTVHETFTLFQLLGAVLYIPAVSSVVFFVLLLFFHFRWRQTIDADIQSGKYLDDWLAIGPVHRVWVHAVLFVGIMIGLCILCSSMARGEVPDQAARWKEAQINPARQMALDIDVALFKRLAPRYQKITDMRPNGVPAPILFCLHQRESSGSFLCHPHEGSPLTSKTRFVPKGRLPNKPAPYVWAESAEDAYYVCDRLDLIDWKNVAAAMQGIESFNGLGYQKYHPDVPSPYLWAATSIYKSGKYTGDGKFDRGAADKQLGCAAILKAMQKSGIKLAWQ